MNPSKNMLSIIVDGFTSFYLLTSLARDFAAGAADLELRSTSYLEAVWKTPPDWCAGTELKGLSLSVWQCHIEGINSTLQLITIPSTSFPRDYQLDAFHLPIRIDGFVLTVDLSLDEDFYDSTKLTPHDSIGGIDWVKETGLPFVVSVSSVEPPILTVDQLPAVLNISPSIPIIYYPREEYSADNRPNHFLAYKKQYTDKVLTKMVQQIQAFKSP